MLITRNRDWLAVSFDNISGATSDDVAHLAVFLEDIINKRHMKEQPHRKTPGTLQFVIKNNDSLKIDSKKII